MKTYAHIVNGVVVSIYSPLFQVHDSPAGVTPAWKRGDEIPITARLDATHIGELTDVTNANPMPRELWTTTDGVTFTAPARLDLSAMTQTAKNTATQAQLMSQAFHANHPNNPLNPRDPSAATKREAWIAYRAQLAAVDLSNPAWPAFPVTE